MQPWTELQKAAVQEARGEEMPRTVLEVWWCNWLIVFVEHPTKPGVFRRRQYGFAENEYKEWTTNKDHSWREVLDFLGTMSFAPMQESEVAACSRE